MGCLSSHSSKDSESVVDPSARRKPKLDVYAPAQVFVPTLPPVNSNTIGELKLLLLGAGESGKSTIFKQIKIIHEQGFSTDETDQYKPIIFSNTIQSLHAIVSSMDRLKIRYSNEARMKDAELLKQVVSEQRESEPINTKLAEGMQRLWADEMVQYCYRRAREYQLNDSAKYYLDSLHRLSSKFYQPTQQDILHTRVKSTGIMETHFTHKQVDFKLVDVGGQRSERKKWVNCFKDVKAILYCVALSAYDLTLREDNSVNRLHESIKLFSTVLNNRWFVDCVIILLLNKIDIFENKLKDSPLTICFPEYTGKNTYRDAIDYIKQQYLNLNKSKDHTIYTHYTCATDTDNIRFVLDTIADSLVEANLTNPHLLI